MEHPILVLPYWIKERINVHSLTRHSLNELENTLSSDELLWVMSLHKVTPCLNTIATRLYDLNPTERIRELSTYEMSDSDAKNACGRYLRVPDSEIPRIYDLLNFEVISTANLHIILTSYASPVVTAPANQLAKQFSDNTTFSRMCKIGHGAILNEYIN